MIKQECIGIPDMILLLMIFCFKKIKIKAEIVLSPGGAYFNERVVKAFLGANIPLKKVRNLGLRKLFTDIGQPLPCETSCRKKVEENAKDDENRLRDILKDEPIFLIVDESENKGKKYLNILGGILNEPNKVYMLEWKKLEKSPERSLVSQGVDDCVRKIGILRQNFNLLLSDAAAYMLKTGKILKQLYPQLLHVQCLSHLLHNCAEEIRTKFKDTDNLIARIKLAVQKNPTRRHMFHEIGTPPNPVITRWGTWLDAAVNYYAKNLPEVKKIYPIVRISNLRCFIRKYVLKRKGNEKAIF